MKKEINDFVHLSETYGTSKWEKVCSNGFFVWLCLVNVATIFIDCNNEGIKAEYVKKWSRIKEWKNWIQLILGIENTSTKTKFETSKAMLYMWNI